MTIIERTFNTAVAVLPVIHVESAVQAAEESVLALATGAHGVFLIQHDGDTNLALEALDAAYAALHAAGHDQPWLGVNLLGLTPGEAYERLHADSAWAARGVWSDSPSGRIIKHSTSDGVYGATYFASVAFKYQPQPVDLKAAIIAEIQAGADVLTTSGPGTGKPCDPAKVRAIRSIVGPDRGVAVASGVKPGNAGELVRAGANALLVNTGIAKNGSFHRADAGKLKALLEAVEAVKA